MTDFKIVFGIAAFGAWLCGCAGELPRAIDGIVAPPVLRVGSPIEVRGRGLAGARLRLTDAPADVMWTAIAATADGVETAIGHLPESTAWRPGQRFAGACLVGGQWPGWQACAAIDSRFRADWGAGAVQWKPAVLAWGATLTVDAEDLQLPGEGATWVEIDDGAQVRTAPLQTTLATGRSRGEITVAPAWTGALPGGRKVRIRLAGQHRGHTSVGPWTAWQPATLAEPHVAISGHPFARGLTVPLAITGVGDQAHLALTGLWLGAQGQTVAQWLPGPEMAFGGTAPVLRSPWFAAHLASLVTLGARQFQGQVRIGVRAYDQTWLAPPLAVDWTLRAVQRVELVPGPGLDAALHRLGLAAAAPQVRARLIDRLRALFAPYAVQVSWSSPVALEGECLRLHLQDRDPNGLGLLGAESGVHKDIGNLVLDEQLGGLNPGAHRAGLAAYGGVFVGEILGFSKVLHPGSAMADPAFDAAVGKWCPVLGGTPARLADLDKAATAIAVIADTVAEVAAHEVGHALGLPAGTAAAHHAGDHPGWIMDAGAARPFVERAGLPGATPSQWGPVDAAYLAAILPP